jgi:AAA15 family ATPase/GTPase
MIERIEIQDFTAFDHLAIDFVSGINLFIGENGTGKTHILKLLYSLQAAEIKGSFSKEISGKILRVFLPRDLSLKRLLRRGKGAKKEASFAIVKDGERMTVTLNGQGTHTTGGKNYFMAEKPLYIPVKEMLANAPGFRSMYAERETHFEEIYVDIIDKAFLPPLKGLDPEFEKLADLLQKTMGGQITTKNEVFYLRNRLGEFEFTLVAEGMRKLALLWLLIRNGSIEKGSTLYWDEPEANLNPSMLPLVVSILLQLERMGVQVFVATHSYVLLKEFDLQRTDHSLRFYSLSMDSKMEISLSTSENYIGLSPNRIADQYARMYNVEVDRALGADNG